MAIQQIIYYAKAIEDELVRSEGDAKKVFDGVDAEGGRDVETWGVKGHADMVSPGTRLLTQWLRCSGCAWLRRLLCCIVSDEGWAWLLSSFQLCLDAWAVAFVMAAPVLLALTARSACCRLAVEVASASG